MTDDTTDPTGITDEGEQTNKEEEYLKQQKQRLEKQLIKAENSNREAMEQLSRRGVNINPLNLTQLRLEVFVSAILGGDSLARLQFEMAWQQALNGKLGELYQQTSEKKIHVPGRD